MPGPHSHRLLFALVTAAMVLVVLALGSLPHPTRVERTATEAAAPRVERRPPHDPTVPATTPGAPLVPVAPGVHEVGPFAVRAGVYVTTGELCSWERRGAAGDVLATDTVSGQALVEVRVTDATFSSSPGCGTWRLFADDDPAPPLSSFGPGTFAVGAQVAPGRWRSEGGDLCYWERLSGLGGGLDELAASAGVPGPTEVVVAPTDVGFSSFGCGTWHPVG